MRRNKGFTLVELVIVIAVIGVLSAVLIPTFSGILEKTRESSRIQQVLNARDEIFSSNNQFNTIEDLNGYIFTIENNVYKLENGTIFNISQDVDINQIKDSYTESSIQSSISTVLIYQPKQIEVEKTYINFTLYEYNKTATVIGYNGTAPEVLVIPSYIQGVFGTETINNQEKTIYCTGENKYKVVSIKSQSFDNESQIKEVILPDTLTNIGDWAFSDCSNITSITIPGSIETIGYQAFYNCSALTEVTILEGVSNIDGYAFSNCTNLKSINFPNSLNYIGYNAFESCSSLESLSIPNSVILIMEHAFENCSNLTNIEFSEGLEEIGCHAFYNCEKLSEVIIPSTVLTIGENAFMYCINLETVTLSEGLQEIQSYAFYYCERLAKIDIPDSVSYIGMSAFEGCGKLNSVTLPDNLQQIEEATFNYCRNLSSINIPSSLISIGNNAFSVCENLVSIILPDTLESIGFGAFSECKSLKAITFNHTSEDTLTIDSQSFILYTSTETIIYVKDTTLINSSICDFDWETSKREVTYNQIEND